MFSTLSKQKEFIFTNLSISFQFINAEIEISVSKVYWKYKETSKFQVIGGVEKHFFCLFNIYWNI